MLAGSSTWLEGWQGVGVGGLQVQMRVCRGWVVRLRKVAYAPGLPSRHLALNFCVVSRACISRDASHDVVDATSKVMNGSILEKRAKFIYLSIDDIVKF